MSKTFWDMKNKVWSLLWQKSTSINFSGTIVGDALNQRVLDFLRGKIVNVLNPKQILTTGKLWITEWSTYLRTVMNSSLSSDLIVWAVTIACDTTNLASSGWVQIGWQVFAYTGKTSTTLTGITAPTILIPSGTDVIQLYTMPTNFEKPKALFTIDANSGTRVGEILLNKANHVAFYEVIKTSTGGNLLKIVWLDSNTLVEIQYSTSYTPMVNDSDICPIPDHYGESAVAFLVAGEMGLDKGIPNAQNILARAYANTQTAFNYFNSESSKPRTQVRPISYQFKSLR